MGPSDAAARTRAPAGQPGLRTPGRATTRTLQRGPRRPPATGAASPRRPTYGRLRRARPCRGERPPPRPGGSTATPARDRTVVPTTTWLQTTPLICQVGRTSALTVAGVPDGGVVSAVAVPGRTRPAAATALAARAAHRRAVWRGDGVTAPRHRPAAGQPRGPPSPQPRPAQRGSRRNVLLLRRNRWSARPPPRPRPALPVRACCSREASSSASPRARATPTRSSGGVVRTTAVPQTERSSLSVTRGSALTTAVVEPEARAASSPPRRAPEERCSARERATSTTLTA